MTKPIYPTRIEDALLVLRPQSGVSLETCQGVCLGVMAMYAALGYGFDVGVYEMAAVMPRNARIEGLPASWREAFRGELRRLAQREAQS